jgi:nitrate reductase gamma subunit
MDVWLHWARGPLFWTALAFMVLGLMRQVGLTVWGAVRAYRKACDRKIPTRQVWTATLSWLVPARRLRNRWPYSLATVVMHAGVILVPLFLAGHIALWKAALGMSWPALPNPVSTALTVAVVLGVLAVVLQRAASPIARPLSRFGDYALPLLVGVTFASGFFAMHPTWNPVAFEPMMLTHVLSADLLLFLVPLSKLSHLILLPFTQLISELAWHFPPDAGSKVAVALGKENEPV